VPGANFKSSVHRLRRRTASGGCARWSARSSACARSGRARVPRTPMIELSRPQMSFAEGLINEEVGPLWEDWMHQVDAVLGDAALVQIVHEALARRETRGHSQRQHQERGTQEAAEKALVPQRSEVAHRQRRPDQSPEASPRPGCAEHLARSSGCAGIGAQLKGLRSWPIRLRWLGGPPR